jgi:acetyl esterase/lipase
MIDDFEATAREQGAELTLDVWASMTHDFQSFGSFLPESQEALKRVGMIIRRYCGAASPRRNSGCSLGLSFA